MAVKRIVILAIAALTLAACGGGSEAAPTPSAPVASPEPAGDPAALFERAFASTSVTENGVDRPLVEGTQAVLTFGVDQLGANAGCNTMSAAASFADGVLTVDAAGMAMTMMACAPELMDQDTWLAGFLTSTPAWSFDGTTLTLASPTTTMTLTEKTDVMQPESMGAGELAGTTFSSTAVHVNGKPRPLAEDSVIELVYEDGIVTARAGCNTLTGAGSFDGGVLVLGPLASTRMACSEALMQQDEWLSAFLASKPTWTFESGVLTLAGGDTTIAFAPKAG